MSHHVQDELHEAAAAVLLRKIKAELHRQYFAILAAVLFLAAILDLVLVLVLWTKMVFNFSHFYM